MSPTYINAARGCGFLLTDEGREALREMESCQCELTINGRSIECAKCQTVYQLGWSDAGAVSREKWRRGS